MSDEKTNDNFEEKWKNKPILLLGDIHYEFKALKNKIEYNDISDCLIICVGDVGFFRNDSNEMKYINSLNSWFEERNILFMSPRGNHDMPHMYNGTVNLSNFKLLPDYTYLNINGEKWGFVGGAISIDRTQRIEGRSYWKDEVFVLKPELVEECDVLITHSCGNFIGPIDKGGISYWCDRDPTLWEECKKERVVHNILMELSKPKFMYCGHFHVSCMIDYNGCKCRILDILEFVEYHPQH
jgi:hypothetical protein